MLTNTVQKYFGDKKIAIIVNEFGDVGIDSKILSNVHSEVLEISEGCICCKLAEEFESGVIEIINKYNPEIIFVETSGASEPFPIFLSLQNLGIAVEGVICVCDSKNFDAYKDNSTAKYQIGGSNIIIMNKTDLVDSEEVERVRKEIVEIKEQFNIKNNMTGKTIFKNYMMHTAVNGVVNQEVFEGVLEIEDIIGIQDEHRHHDHTSKDSITQKVAYIKKEIAFDDFDKLLSALPVNIYRSKGIIKASDVNHPIFFNYSFGDVSYEPLENYDGESIVIFIGELIEEETKALVKEFNFLNFPLFRISK